jgi:PI-3-kinase-related kinase SMG-1
MDDISPKLYSLRNTVIAMPGLGTAGQIVTIESVSNTVQILPTKTKPKKLVFKGSDGKRYELCVLQDRFISIFSFVMLYEYFVI